MNRHSSYSDSISGSVSSSSTLSAIPLSSYKITGSLSPAPSLSSLPISPAALSGGLEIDSDLSDYEQLKNLPYLNHRLLLGSLTLEDIGAQPAGQYILSETIQITTPQEIENIFKL